MNRAVRDTLHTSLTLNAVSGVCGSIATVWPEESALWLLKADGAACYSAHERR